MVFVRVWGLLAMLLFGLLAGGCQLPSAQTRAVLAAAGVSGEGQLSNVEGSQRLVAGGYDVVAYFVENRAVRGSEQFTTRHDGALYRFATSENRERFLASPDQYTPEYGGWCATAMANGDWIDVDPTSFRVTNGRLYLFFRLVFINARARWDDDPAGTAQRADREWRELVNRTSGGS